MKEEKSTGNPQKQGVLKLRSKDVRFQSISQTLNYHCLAQVQAGAGGLNGLYIKHVNHHHTGWYECVAITTINNDRKGAYLTVLGAIQ